MDYESRFREDVIERFADSYIAGETPIPCVECNKSVKFRDLLAFAEDLGADCLATGHYVIAKPLENGHRGLFRPLDAARDQSYFLYATDQAQLDRLRFPLGAMPKAKTREIAREFGLSIAEKADSQDICFVPSGDYASLVAKMRPEAAREGVIRHRDGQVLGTHPGVIHFTIGQRRGLGIAARDPLYVISIDAAKGEIIVGPREALFTTSIPLRDINWLGDTPLDALTDKGVDLHVRVRSTRAPRPAHLRIVEGQTIIELEAGEDGVSPGQACVFYEDGSESSRVLGGGTIQSAAALAQPRISARHVDIRHFGAEAKAAASSTLL